MCLCKFTNMLHDNTTSVLWSYRRKSIPLLDAVTFMNTKAKTTFKCLTQNRPFSVCSVKFGRSLKGGRLFWSGLVGGCVKRVNGGCFSALLPTLRVSVSCGAGGRCPKACGSTQSRSVPGH